MGSTAAAGTRCFAFGDLREGIWGAAWAPNGAEAVAVLAAGNQRTVGGGQLLADSARGTWELQLDGSLLVVEGIGERVELADGERGFDQLCEVRGEVQAGGETAALRCLGWMQRRDPEVGDSFSSFRRAAGWFGPTQGVALTALRAGGARAHDRDQISAAVFGEDRSVAATDPRISTTYGSDGEPARAGLELWVVGSEGEDLYAVRAAGEATGPVATWSAGSLQLHARPFRWHSRGREGAGVYMLGAQR